CLEIAIAPFAARPVGRSSAGRVYFELTQQELTAPDAGLPVVFATATAADRPARRLAAVAAASASFAVAAASGRSAVQPVALAHLAAVGIAAVAAAPALQHLHHRHRPIL